MYRNALGGNKAEWVARSTEQRKVRSRNQLEAEVDGEKESAVGLFSIPRRVRPKYKKQRPLIQMWEEGSDGDFVVHLLVSPSLDYGGTYLLLFDISCPQTPMV